jgi:hypothetical protein
MKTLLFVLLTVILLFACSTPADAQTKSKTESSPGLSVTTFDAPEGAIKVCLPGDMAAGDTISGTVVLEPAGQNEVEKRKNSNTLEGYVIQIETQKFPAAGGVIQRVVLPAQPILILLDPNGKQTARVPIPLAPAPHSPAKPTFQLPINGQTGRPIEVQGPFDGDSSNTTAKVGDAPAKILAESPRKLVVDSPRDVVGPTQIEVKENGRAATAPFRNLKISLTAPKTSLLKGESTELHVEVQGLEGLTQPVQVQLENHSPSIVNLGRGNTQNIVVPANPSSTNGQQIFTRTLTGVTPGTFNITAGIEPHATQPQPSRAP